MKSLTKKACVLILISIFALNIATDLSACDTWVALANATKLRFTILAKNSDRLPFSCQPLMFYPRKKWQKDAKINLGRITIPQVKETYATMGSSPYWCWGYEEGINEFGVAIGNEGIFTKVLAEAIDARGKGKGPKMGPTGMDLVRLGLERGKTAQEALKIITSLVEKYGQFGSGMPTMGVDGAYDNSYIIADPKEAWVLETAGTRWIARKFSNGVTSISNKLSITTEWNLSSADIVDYAVKKAWWPKEKKDKFNFEQAYSANNPIRKDGSFRAKARQDCSYRLLREKEGEVTPRWMMRIARDRSSNPSIDLDQTASSCVAILPNTSDELPVFWWCASTPSSSCYVPFFVHGSQLPEIVSTAGTFGKKIIPPSRAQQDAFSPNSYWWLFKDLRDKVNMYWNTRNPIVRTEFDALEKEFATGIPEIMKKAVELIKAGKQDEAAKALDDFTSGCVDKALKKVNELRERFETEVIEVPAEFKPYVGIYIANFGQYRNAEFNVLVKNNRLAVNIPNQRLVELKEPDEEDLWYFTVTNRIAVSFDRDEEGLITTLIFHETSVLPRKSTSDEPPLSDIPDEFKPYIGKYSIPMGNVECTVLVKNGNLAIDIPNQIEVELKPPDKKGRRYFAIDSTTSVSFDRNAQGNVTALKIHQTFKLPKKK